MFTDIRTPEELAAAIQAALETAARYGGRETAHHKAWVIDQMCRALAGDGYAIRRQLVLPTGANYSGRIL